MKAVHIFVCTNARDPDAALPSCGPAGGTAVHDAFVRELARLGWPRGLKVTASACLTPCQIGPNVVVYPDGVWYCGVSPDDVPEIVAAHGDGRTVSRLLKPDHVSVW